MMIACLIAITGFAHIVAGSVEGFRLVVSGDLAVGDGRRFHDPGGAIGNIIGGTALFAVISNAQVMKEM